MAERRVGFHGEDEALFVELALRSEGLTLTRVDRVEQLRDFDVALLDVPSAGDAVRLARSVPTGPPIVLLTHQGQGVPGTTVVRRPCSLGTLVAVLCGSDTVDVDDDVVITLPPEPTPPLFTATDRPRRRRSRGQGPR